MRWAAFALLIGHGWVHGVMWALPYSEEAMADLPMDPSRSWLVGEQRAFALGLALVTAAAFVAAAVAYIAGAGWWPPAAISASALSIVLMTLFYSPWWFVGFAIDAVVLVAAFRSF